MLFIFLIVSNEVLLKMKNTLCSRWWTKSILKIYNKSNRRS